MIVQASLTMQVERRSTMCDRIPIARSAALFAWIRGRSPRPVARPGRRVYVCSSLFGWQRRALDPEILAEVALHPPHRRKRLQLVLEEGRLALGLAVRALGAALYRAKRERSWH